MTRIPLIAGNWKMHKTAEESVAYIRALNNVLILNETRVFLAVPFTAIEQASAAAHGTRITIGAQNMHDAEEGPFTGEISASMLKAAGAQFVILGHSERRKLFGETSEFINRKVHRAFNEGIIPILCVGETLEQRQQESVQHVLSKQLKEALNGLDASQIPELIIAYEPVWAIGTGKSATPDIAQEVHRMIRLFLEHSYGNKVAERVCLLYGGSVNPGNIAELMKEPDIDGALVGGASLDVAAFARMIQL